MDRSALAPDTLFSCAGQVAIVTGAGTGIGRSCAQALAAAGARVALARLADSEPERAAAELTAHGAPRASR
jgi:NAD(P)-dependent dehydrogenase (short-subunit alcohol dehydrogenase family)